MKMMRAVTLISCLGLVFSVPYLGSSPSRVEVTRLPAGAIQPQTAVGENGTVHLVYYKGDPSEGDLFYARSEDGIHFSDPVRVNSVPGSAVAIGNIRGARIAVGRRGRVYVVWNGSRKAAGSDLQRSPMLYARLDNGGKEFEPERNLIHSAYGIDGGGGIAADRQGRVYVFWHAPIPGHQGEQWRRVWMARSDDDGNTFKPERIAFDNPAGACGCCSLNAFADRAGKVYVLFRGAQDTVHRDMYLLESADHGSTFRGSDISKWDVGYCVMSSEAFASGPSSAFAAWETEKKVHYGRIGPGSGVSGEGIVSGTGVNEKYPSLAIGNDGQLLVAWTEGMGWKRGGSVHWRVLDKNLRPGSVGSADGVPAWSLVAAYPAPNGKFVVLY